jgi:hypothetical protein
MFMIFYPYKIGMPQAVIADVGLRRIFAGTWGVPK